MSRSERSNGHRGGLSSAPSAYDGRARRRCVLSLDRGSMRVESARGRAGIGLRIVKTFELLSIIGSIAAVGLALGAIVIGSNANLHMELRTDMQSLQTEMRTEMQGLRTDVRTDIRSLEIRLTALERRQARTEGLLEGLRDAITARGLHDPQGQAEAT